MKNLRVKVTEYGEQQLEALGLPTSLEFELNDGSTVTLVHPWLWDDDTVKAYEAANDGDGPRDIRLAKAALGAKEHARFIKGGGKSSLIAIGIEMMKRPTDEDDADPKDE
jgi:hypothetical protein